MTSGCVRYGTGMFATVMDAVTNLPECPVPVWMPYRTYQVSGTGIEFTPNLPQSPVPILMSYRTYQSVRYWYRCRAEPTKVSCTVIDVPIPVMTSYRYRYRHRYRFGYIYRRYLYRAYPVFHGGTRSDFSLYGVQKVPFGLSPENSFQKNKRPPLS